MVEFSDVTDIGHHTKQFAPLIKDWISRHQNLLVAALYRLTNRDTFPFFHDQQSHRLIIYAFAHQAGHALANDFSGFNPGNPAISFIDPQNNAASIGNKDTVIRRINNGLKFRNQPLNKTKFH
ncbi:hypothetical protein SDC9_173434 [bioreactor metagenome]|uniref:Uncharacterized protein n=1 Tax=bioreactor metagenome TaxID=1076179 RepID=A0A645GJE5_9ZZZZ